MNHTIIKNLVVIVLCVLLSTGLVGAYLPDFVFPRNVSFHNTTSPGFGLNNASFLCLGNSPNQCIYQWSDINHTPTVDTIWTITTELENQSGSLGVNDTWLHERTLNSTDVLNGSNVQTGIVNIARLDSQVATDADITSANDRIDSVNQSVESMPNLSVSDVEGIAPNVTLASPTRYLSISGQEITASLVDLANHITGILSISNINMSEIITNIGNWSSDRQNYVNFTSGDARYLQDVVEDTTPALGGELDADNNNIISLGDLTFKTGAQGGTIRTGTSNADKWVLQAYDVNDAVYRKVAEADAGNEPTFEVFSPYFQIWDSVNESNKAHFNLSLVEGDVVLTLQDASGVLAYLADINDSWNQSHADTLYEPEGTYAGVGDCPAGEVVQNTTTAGVECVTQEDSAESDPVWTGNASRVGTLETQVSSLPNLSVSDVAGIAPNATAGYGISITGQVVNVSADSCSSGEYSRWNGTGFACFTDTDTQQNYVWRLGNEVVGNNSQVTSGQGIIFSSTAISANVTSVNGLNGTVVLDTDDITEGSNLYYTDARAAGAVQNTSIARKGSVVNTTSSFGGEASGTYDAIVLDHDALNDQYVQLEGDTMTGDLTLVNLTLDAIDHQVNGTVRTFANGCSEVANSTGLYWVC